MSATPPVNVQEFEALAQANMEPGAFGYYFGGAEDEITLRRNREAFAELGLLPRVLVDVSSVDTAVEIFGARSTSPILIAPTAFHRLAHPDGELATARAAARAGTIYAVSTIATTRLEEVAAVAPGAPRWFQLYVYKDRAVTEELVARAEASGYGAIVLTVDTPRLGRRERDLRNGFRLPEGVTIANFDHIAAAAAAGSPITGWREGSSFAAYIHDLMDAALDWRAVDWLKSRTRLPLLVKGVLAPGDAERALGAGVDGIVVSNHGGRQLDGAVASIEALPAIAERVAGRCPVLMDGGVRRGADVVKAIALGAQAVLVGRPVLWGLAANGEEGVVAVLETLRREFELAMALCGCSTVGKIDRSLVSV